MIVILRILDPFSQESEPPANSGRLGPGDRVPDASQHDGRMCAASRSTVGRLRASRPRPYRARQCHAPTQPGFRRACLRCAKTSDGADDPHDRPGQYRLQPEPPVNQFFSAFLSTGVPGRARKYSVSSFDIGAYSIHEKQTGLLASTQNDYYNKPTPREPTPREICQ